MALVRIARFHTLSEAEVAASVLRSAGIPALVADAHYLGVFWTDTIALGGFRLSVPEEEAEDAVAILRSASPAEPIEEDSHAPLPTPQRLLAGALMVTVGAEGGWLATARETPASVVEKGAGALLTMVLLVCGGGLALLALAYALQLLFNPP